MRRGRTFKLWLNKQAYSILKALKLAKSECMRVNGGSMSDLSEKLDRVSDYFIWKAHQTHKSISNKKLQKLVYYAQAWNLVFNNENLFDDPIEAWIHGPAIRSLYVKYKKYGYMSILDKPLEPALDKQEKAILEDVWNVYGKYDADYLEILTHTEEPWKAARGEAESDERTEATINTTMMKNFYGKLLKETRS